MRNNKGQFIKGHKPLRGFQKGHKLNIGSKHTKEWKEMMSKKMKGRISPMKGKKMPQSAKIAIGNALRGKPVLKIRGEKHYNWKNNRSKLQAIIRHRAEYGEWRKKVFERDNYTCQICEAKNGKGKSIILNADHYPKHFYKILDDNNISEITEAMNCKELWDINNGRTLCRECHKKTFKFHSNQYVKT